METWTNGVEPESGNHPHVNGDWFSTRASGELHGVSAIRYSQQKKDV